MLSPTDFITLENFDSYSVFEIGNSCGKLQSLYPNKFNSVNQLRDAYKIIITNCRWYILRYDVMSAYLSCICSNIDNKLYYNGLQVIHYDNTNTDCDKMIDILYIKNNEWICDTVRYGDLETK